MYVRMHASCLVNIRKKIERGGRQSFKYIAQQRLNMTTGVFGMNWCGAVGVHVNQSCLLAYSTLEKV